MLNMTWPRILNAIDGILLVVVLLIGMIVAFVSYSKDKNKAALTGAIGLLILFLFSCCITAWDIGEPSIVQAVQRQDFRSFRTYYNIKSILVFLGGLIRLAGLIAVIVAIVQRSKQD